MSPAAASAVAVDELRATARALAARGKGILACDESVSTLGKRLTAAGLADDAETRRAWRDVLLSADNAAAYAGAILFSETLAQAAADGTPFPALLAAKRVLPGAKVDLGLQPLPGRPRETRTAGLDGLAARCDDARRRGARFAKWRSALRVDAAAGLPSDAAVDDNARGLARYAATAQRAGLVPIVEPEILIDGDHDMDTSARVARRVIAACYRELARENVPLDATLLKPMMIMPGLAHPDKATVTPEQIARATLDCMRDVVPPEVPGIMFLSGGMSEVQATENLNALNKLADAESAPWTLSFSFGRALQSSVLKAWAGEPANVPRAQEIAAALAAVNAQAQLGKYTGHNHPSIMEGATLYEGYRGWRGGENSSK